MLSGFSGCCIHSLVESFEPENANTVSLSFIEIEADLSMEAKFSSTIIS
jgi:hypothetical protein